MAIRKYDFDFHMGEASAAFDVDTNLFTPELAKEALEFFTWEYDHEADPVDECLKKYAIQAIKFATFNSHNELGVISDFKDEEGFFEVDGQFGVTLTEVSAFEFDDYFLDMEVKYE